MSSMSSSDRESAFRELELQSRVETMVVPMTLDFSSSSVLTYKILGRNVATALPSTLKETSSRHDFLLAPLCSTMPLNPPRGLLPERCEIGL